MNTYKFDTHVHTCDTSRCGVLSAVEVARLYKNAGYDGIIITDHYHQEYFDSLGEVDWGKKAEAFLKGYRAARDEGARVGLKVLLGMEIRFPESNNDYLIFGIDESYIQQQEALYRLDLSDFRKRTKADGVTIVQAHPCREGLTLADPLLLDGVEVYNGNARHDSHNSLARAFAEKYGLKMTSGSDLHEREDLGRGGVLLPQMPETSADFAAMLQSGSILQLFQTQ